jgi:hypothetical protein
MVPTDPVSEPQAPVPPPYRAAEAANPDPTVVSSEDESIDLDALEKLDSAAIADLATGGASPPVARPTLEDWDPEPGRDIVRKWIAFWLLGILTFVIAAIIGLVCSEQWTHLTTDDVRTISELLFAPVVTLVSAVTGFYYASNPRARVGRRVQS